MPGPPPRRHRPTLAQRSAASGLGWAGHDSPRTGSPRTDPTRTGWAPRHCWVLVDGQAHAGLLLVWERRHGPDGGWWGRVACTLGHADRPEDESLVVAWMPADRLRPA